MTTILVTTFAGSLFAYIPSVPVLAAVYAMSLDKGSTDRSHRAQYPATIMNRMTKNKHTPKHIDNRIIGWVSIVIWIPLMIILSRSDFFNNLIPPMDVEGKNILMHLLFLAPIALIALPLTYSSDLIRRFTKEGKPSSVSIAGRIIFSAVATAIIVMVSWFLLVWIRFRIGM